MKEYLAQLEKVMSTEADWNGYGSEAPSELAGKNAKLILDVLSQMAEYHMPSLPRAQINPSAEGGIGISFSTKDKYGFIECFNDGEILAAFSDYKIRDIWKLEDYIGHSIIGALYKIDMFFRDEDN